MIDVRRLRLLRELHLRGTLAAVAEALSYSPSSVSQQLDQLEREVGVALLEKAGRRVQLTPQAEVLVAHAAAVLDRLEEAETDVARSLTTVSGVVRIAVFQSAAHALLPQALTVLGREYPDLRVEVTEREPEAGLFEVQARDFDIVIAEQYPGHTRPLRTDLDHVGLCADVIRLAVPSGTVPHGAAPDAASGAVPVGFVPAEATHLPWVMEPAGTAARAWATQLCRTAGFEPDVRFETADLMAHIRLIRSGNAIGLLPDLVWAGEAPSVRLVELPGTPHRDIFTSARRSAAGHPGVAACREALARAVVEAATPAADAADAADDADADAEPASASASILVT